MAFGMYRSGDENSVLHVMDVGSGDWLPEEIPGKVRLLRWLPDGNSIYYARLEALDDPYSTVVKLHRMGTHHRQDRVLFRQKDLDFFYGDLGKSAEELEVLRGTWGPGALISRDGGPQRGVPWFFQLQYATQHLPCGSQDQPAGSVGTPGCASESEGHRGKAGLV